MFMRLLFLALTVLGAAWAATSARASPPIAAYGRLPALDMVRLSPNGERIAFVAVDGEKRRLFVRKVGGEALRVDDVGDTKVRDLQWAGDDLILLSVGSTLKFGNGLVDKWSYSTRAEVLVVLVVNLKTNTITNVFKGDQQAFLSAVQRVYGVRQVDGRWHGVFQVLTVGVAYDLFDVDLESGKTRKITDPTSRDDDYLIGADGGIAARERYEARTGVWKLLAGDKGERTVTATISPFDKTDIAGFGRTPGTVLVTNETPTDDTIQEYPLAPGAAPTRLFKDLEVQGLVRDRQSDLLIGATVRGDPGIVFLDDKLQRRWSAARRAFPGLHVTLTSYSSDFGKLVVFTNGGDDSGAFWLVDMTTGKADELTAAYPAIGPADVGPTRLYTYAAADGQAIEGVLTLPPGKPASPLPLVVMPHGGPLGINDDIGFDWWAQAFASQGYAVFQPNYRGSSGYGAVFRNAGYGQWGAKMLTDISDGVAALAKSGIVDRGRVCIVGGSYGGYAALAGVTLQRGVYRCAVSVSGVSDVGALMANWGDSGVTAGGRYARAMFGVTSAIDPSMAAISPLRRADEASAPILMIHGKDDTVVPFVNSASMDGALTTAGKTVEFIPTEGEDHWLSREKTRVQTLEASVAFVEKYNPAK
jgi:dipeptidyl aminopeptidase/acylaminoacyl peptidase